MKKLYKKKKGSMSIELIFVIGILFLVSTAAFIPFGKISSYFKLSNVCRTGMNRIEADGGMTQETKEKIIESAKSQGLDINNLTIKSNEISEERKDKSTFGENVYLELKYKWVYDVPIYKSFKMVGKEKKSEEIKTYLSSSAKN